MTPDAASPSCASLVQGAIGATNAFAFDVSATVADLSLPYQQD